MKFKKIKRIIVDTFVILTKKRLPITRRLHFLFDYLKINAMGYLHGRITTFKQVHFLGFVVTPASFSELVMLVHEVFVDEPYYFVSDTKKPNVIDCGGNIGMSVLYFKWLYPDATVTVFEPSPIVCDVLRKNVANNKLTDVSIVEKALSNEEGTVTFYLREGMTLAGTTEKKESYGSQSCEVKSTKLSNFVKDTIDFMKIDVQFSEQRIFEDLAHNRSWKYVNELIMEFHHAHGYTSNSFAKTILSLEESDLHYFINLNSKKSEIFASYIVQAKKVSN